LNGLPENTTIESVMYPPNVPAARYRSAYYPFRFRIFHSDPVPGGHNIGCLGLEQRRPDYLILDGFTYTLNCIPDKRKQLYGEDYRCWKNIMDGATRYSRFRTFSYNPPDWFPKVKVGFANPVIWIFRRAPEG
jgi:hypothetical protein